MNPTSKCTNFNINLFLFTKLRTESFCDSEGSIFSQLGVTHS